MAPGQVPPCYCSNKGSFKSRDSILWAWKRKLRPLEGRNPRRIRVGGSSRPTPLWLDRTAEMGKRERRGKGVKKSKTWNGDGYVRQGYRDPFVVIVESMACHCGLR